MVRKRFIRQRTGFVPDLRWRGNDVSRIESFSDAVFAFAVTLLVVSLEVPKTFGELLVTMRGFFAFAICFAMLVYVWYSQYKFFRRYGLRDPLTITLNAVLLFVVLFYVYPLKFVFSLVVNQLMGASTLVRLADGTLVPQVDASQGPIMMIIYGSGYVAVFLILALLYLHAWRRREMLRLSELELCEARTNIQGFLVNVCVGLLSISIAVVGGQRQLALSGFSYFLLGPAITVHRMIMSRRMRSIRERLDEERRGREQSATAQAARAIPPRKS